MRKQKGQWRIDNLETLATLNTQNTGRIQTKQENTENQRDDEHEPTKIGLLWSSNITSK